MPHTNHAGGLRILARRDALTDEDWINLLNERRSLIKPHLREMTLPTLGELNLVGDYFGHHSLKRDIETLTITGERFDLDTRAIFPMERSIPVLNTDHHVIREVKGHSFSGRTERFWGLTRDAEWIWAEVFITKHPVPYKDRREIVARARVVNVELKTTTELKALVPPKLVWEALGNAIKNWEKHRENLLGHAAELAQVVRTEEKLLSLVDRPYYENRPQAGGEAM